MFIDNMKSLAVLLYCPIITPHSCNLLGTDSYRLPQQVWRGWCSPEAEADADCGPVMIFMLKNSTKWHNVFKNVLF